VTNAVNIPSVRPEDLDVLGPLIPLAAKLGRLAMELAEGRAERIELAYFGALAGYDTRLLTVAALNGAFQGRSDGPVNYVNAPLLAAERGIEVAEQRGGASRDFTNLVRVTVRAEGGEFRVAGTTIGGPDRYWLVNALGFQLEIELAPLMVFFGYDDVPGVIGRVGTMLGESGVNIANMAVSRSRQGGRALMAMTIDSPAPPELVERFHREGFVDGRFIALD
jgi:D-3-phosphoglycerate dehydrogenase